jgi:hypothetical protein
MVVPSRSKTYQQIVAPFDGMVAQRSCQHDKALFRVGPCQCRREICDRLNAIEEQIANMMPTTIPDCSVQLSSAEISVGSVPDELGERLVDNELAWL